MITKLSDAMSPVVTHRNMHTSCKPSFPVHFSYIKSTHLVPYASSTKHAKCSIPCKEPFQPCTRKARSRAHASTRRPICSAAPNQDREGAKTPLRVCIVGGGVVGLTSALRILQSRHLSDISHSASSTRPLEVTVVASRFGAETTSAGAAGLWGPYKLSDTPDSLVNRWGAATYDHLLQLTHSPDADLAGVSMCSVNSFYSEPQPLPSWRHIPTAFQVMDERMLAATGRTDPWVSAVRPSPPQPPAAAPAKVPSPSLTSAPCPSPSSPLALSSDPESLDPKNPLPIGWGYHWDSVVCEGARYLPFLTVQIEALGGRLLRRPALSSLSQLSDVDVVVNAAGLGSRELLPDEQVVGIRGQVIRVVAHWVKQAYFFEPFYIIPNRDTVVLGGTGQIGDTRLAPCPIDRARILAGCIRLLPSLSAATPVTDWVGLRPGRRRLRLEWDRAGVALADGRVVPVVHNYGHGGAGLTLAWGCAGDVVEVLRQEGVL